MLTVKNNVLKEFKPDEILSLVTGIDKRLATFTIDGKEYEVNIGSIRLKCFSQNTRCVRCGIDGNIVSLEKQRNGKGFHFNLYHKTDDGEYILMTKDHKKPRSLGGGNGLYNMQTMCTICNNKKGHKTKGEVIYTHLHKKDDGEYILGWSYRSVERARRSVNDPFNQGRLIDDKAEKEIFDILNLHKDKTIKVAGIWRNLIWTEVSPNLIQGAEGNGYFVASIARSCFDGWNILVPSCDVVATCSDLECAKKIALRLYRGNL